MANTYSAIYIHYVFSTKKREPWLRGEMQERVWQFMGGIARENKMKALAVGGMSDHAHLLVSLPTTIAIAKGVQLIKAGSSMWVHETFATTKGFGWQDGYSAFSVSASVVERTVEYILNQAEHHRTKTFQEEYRTFLKKHRIEYDERYIWD